MAKLTCVIKVFLTALLVLLLPSCGGGGDSSTSNPPPTTTNPPPAPTVFTETNTPEIGTLMILLTEGVVEVSELIESEFIWFYHAPDGITVRNCPEGGTVSWNLQTSSKLANSGTVIFNDCLLTPPSPSGAETTVINAAVSISFDLTQYDQVLVNSNQKLIQQFTITMASNEFFVGAHNQSGVAQIRFNMSSSSEQSWQDTSVEYPISALKSKEVTIDDFSLMVADNQYESITQGTLTQYESPTPNSNGYMYELNIDGRYTSDPYAVNADLEGIVFLTDLPITTNYSNRNITGNFFVTQGNENIAASFNNEWITLSSSSGFSGSALTYEVVEDLLFRLINNRLIFEEIQKVTPLVLVDISPSTQQLETTEQNITLTFNKDVTSTAVRVFEPINFSIAPEFVTLNEHQLTIEAAGINQIKTMFELDNLDLFVILYTATASYVQPGQELELQLGFTLEDKGKIITLDTPITEIGMLSNGDMVGYKASHDTDELVRFDPMGNKLYSQPLATRHSNLCIDKNTDELYFTKTRVETHYERLIVQLDDSFAFQQEWFLDAKNIFGVDCYDDLILYYDISPNLTSSLTNFAVNLFNFSDKSIKDLGLSDYGQVNSKAINRNTQNQTYTLITGSYIDVIGDYQEAFAIIESDFSQSPIIEQRIQIEQGLLDYNRDEYAFFTNRDFPIRASLDNRLFVFNKVFDLTNNQLLFEFSNTAPAHNEYFRMLLANDLLVTSKAVYDSNTYQKLFTLPFIANDLTEEKWFLDNQNRLNVLIGPTIIYQTSVLR